MSERCKAAAGGWRCDLRGGHGGEHVAEHHLGWLRGSSQRRWRDRCCWATEIAGQYTLCGAPLPDAADVCHRHVQAKTEFLERVRRNEERHALDMCHSLGALCLLLLAGCGGPLGEDTGAAECCEPTDAGNCIVRFIDYSESEINPFDDTSEREVCAELGLEPAPRRHYEEIEL